MRRGWLVASLAMAALPLPYAGEAQESTRPKLEITFDAPAGCPGLDHVTKEVERLLGAARLSGSPLSARGSVTAKNGGFVLDLVVEREGTTTSRRLEARSCETAADVAALLISLAHAPDVVGKPPPEPPPEAPPEPPPKPQPPKPPPVVPPSVPPLPKPRPVAPTEPQSILGWLLRAGPIFGVGDLPFPQVGGQAAVGIRIEAWTVEAGFEAGFASTRIVEDRPDAGANFLRIVGVLRGCRVLVPFMAAPWPRESPGVDFSACVGFEAGQLSGETFGVFQPEEATSLWLAPQLDLRLGIGITQPLSLVPNVGLAFPLTRPSFVIAANEPKPILIHQPGPVAGRAGVTFEAQF